MRYFTLEVYDLARAHKTFFRSCASGVKIILAGYAARHPGSLRRGSCLVYASSDGILKRLLATFSQEGLVRLR